MLLRSERGEACGGLESAARVWSVEMRLQAMTLSRGSQNLFSDKLAFDRRYAEKFHGRQVTRQHDFA